MPGRNVKISENEKRNKNRYLCFWLRSERKWKWEKREERDTRKRRHTHRYID